MVPYVESDAQVLFGRWFRRPIEKLKELPGGDGAFVALMIACALYERYATSVLKEQSLKADMDEKEAQLASDFHVAVDTAHIFWDIMRNGLAHGAQPKARAEMRTRKRRRGKEVDMNWFFSHDLPGPIALERDAATGRPQCLKVQPWMFADEVLRLWEKRPDLPKSPRLPVGLHRDLGP